MYRIGALGKDLSKMNIECVISKTNKFIITLHVQLNEKVSKFTSLILFTVSKPMVTS